MRPKAIIFDMDGVLFHSSNAHNQAFRQVLDKIGIHRFNYGSIAGMKTVEVMKKILRSVKMRYSTQQLATWSKRKQDLAYRLLAKHPPVAKGCRAHLARLAQTYRLALASSSRRLNVDLFLDASRTRDLFSWIVTGEDLTRGKPSPMIYQKVLKGLHLAPSEAVVVEDAVQGVRAAVHAGIPVMALPGESSVMDLRQAGAFRIIHTIQDMT
jgi:HAD superfamily hydrolase (TIGR01509 family)